ncbi:MAG: TIGR03936 family radical SAM-associated protein, partial [bacterium]
ADFSCIGPLARKLSAELERRQKAMAVSSMRVYGMTDTLGESLSKVRRAGFTIAPEAGSQRLRDVINKGITEAVILEGANSAFKNGWSHVKLYFMIGLPTETETDLRAIVDLGVKILRLAEQEHGKKAQVTISVSSHIPKPHAPFQWLGFENRDSLRQKQKYLSRLIQQHKRLRFKWDDVDHSWLEAIFSRGDRRLNKVVELAYRRGCRFDAWTDQIKLSVWRQVFEDLSIDPEVWMQDIPLYATLPWDHLDSRVKKEFLVRELKRALKGRFSPACEKPYKKKSDHDRTDLGKPEESDKLVCYHCGLDCDLDAIRRERIESWKSLEKDRRVPAQPEGGGEVQVARATRYRAAYCKLGEFRFLSALDLTRTFTRAFSRSGIPLKFSQGFHPAPVISFGPALGVGLESAEEFLDFETIGFLRPEILLQKLNEQLPVGLQFTAVQIIDPKADSLFRIISAAEYSVSLSSKELTTEINKRLKDRFDGDLRAVHRKLVADLLKEDRIPIERISKGKRRMQDIKPLIKCIEVVNTVVPLHLRMILSTGSSGSLRPELILSKLYNCSGDLFEIRRERLLVEKGGKFCSPFEL